MDRRTELVWHLEKLPYFIAVAEAGSFRRAADRLRLAQPSLSKAIAALEGAAGVTLFARQKSGAALTREGAVLLAAARDILRTAAKAQADLTEAPAGRTLGLVTHELLVPLLAQALSGFAWGDASARIQTSASVRQLLDWVEDYRADCAVVATSPPRKGVRQEPLFTDEYRFFCARSQKRRYAGARRADELPLVLAPDVLAGPGETLADHLARRGIRLSAKHAVGSLESVAALTASGFGVGLMPARIARLLQGKKLAELPVKLPGLAAIGPHGFFFCCREDTWRQDQLARAVFTRVEAAARQSFAADE